MKLISNLFVVTMLLSASVPAYSEETQDISTIQDISKEPVAKLLNSLLEEKQTIRNYIISNSACVKTDKETVLRGEITGSFSGLFSSGELKGWIEGKTKTTGQAEIFICKIAIPSETSETHYEKLITLKEKSRLHFSPAASEYYHYLEGLMVDKVVINEVTSRIEDTKKIINDLEKRMIDEKMTELQRLNFLELKDWYQSTKLIIFKHNPDRIYNFLNRGQSYGDKSYKFNFVEHFEDRSSGGIFGINRIIEMVSIPPAIYIDAIQLGDKTTYSVMDGDNEHFLDFLLSKKNNYGGENSAIEPYEILFY